jgi:hypothetical protein
MEYEASQDERNHESHEGNRAPFRRRDSDSRRPSGAIEYHGLNPRRRGWATRGV